MFGFSGGKRGAPNDEEEEAKRRKIEALQKSLTASVDSMKPFAQAGMTEKCEAVIERLKKMLQDPILPADFKKDTHGRMDLLLCEAYMKAADLAVKDALRAAMKDNREIRDKKIAEAREKLSGAVRLKAPPEFKMGCERAIEIAYLSGGIKKEGPTKAKPGDFAPKPKKSAKPDAKFYEAQAKLEKERLEKEKKEWDAQKTAVRPVRPMPTAPA